MGRVGAKERRQVSSTDCMTSEFEASVALHVLNSWDSVVQVGVPSMRGPVNT